MKTVNELKDQLSLGIKTLKLVFRSSPAWAGSLFILNILVQVAPIGMLYLIKTIVDSLVTFGTRPHPDNLGKFLWLCLAVIAYRTFHFAVIRLRRHCENVLKDRFGNFITLTISDKIASLDFKYFEDPITQDKIEKIRRETGHRPFESMSSVSAIVGLFFGVIGLLFALGSVAWWIPIIVSLASLPRLYFSFHFSYTTYRITDRRSPISRKFNVFLDFLTSRRYATEAKIFDLKEFFLNNLRTIQQSFLKENQSLSQKTQLINFAINNLLTLAAGISTIYTGWLVILGKSTVGSFNFVMNSINRLDDQYAETFEMIARFYENSLFLNDFFEFLEITPTIKETPDQQHIDLKKPLEIEFKNVNFSYNNSENMVLKNISFKLDNAHNLAIIGENGAGKTTLIKLLLRLYDVTSGEILINGINIKNIKLGLLHKALSVIYQDFSAYPMTVRENISLGDIEERDNLEEIKRAAKLSGADEFIEELPKKYDTMLGKMFDEGVDLSGGQWQKIAIARGFFRNSPAIIMDEPTSALDPKSEYNFFNNLIKETKNKSLILISHRFSTVRLADKIIVLHKGEIVEEGSHEKLMKEKGRYAKLYNLQAKWYK